MNPIITRLLATALLLLPAAVAGAQEPPTFDETTTVVLVEIPVNVVRDNQPVRGLTAADFEVFERRRAVELANFEVVDLALVEGVAPEVGETPLPIEGRRHFLLLFDLSFTRPDVLVVAVNTARDLVRTDLHPSDLVGVAVASASYGVEVLLGFTPDRRQVEQVLDHLDLLLDRDEEKLRQAQSSRRDALGLVAGGLPELTAQIGRAAGRQISVTQETLEWGYWAVGGGGWVPALAFEMVSEMNKEANEDLRERHRSLIQNLSETMADLARLTAAIEGRKILVYFSEGIDSRMMELGAGHGEEAGGGGSKVLRYLTEMVNAFRRSGWTIYSVDPGGLRHDDEDWRFSNEDSLNMIARDTGGEFFRNFNDLGTAMAGMLEKTSVTYLLSFYANDVPIDGSFHPVRITLRDRPWGTRLFHPAGYVAPKPWGEQEGIENALTTGELILRGDEGGELEAAALVAAFRDPTSPRVNVLVEASGPSLLGDEPRDRLEVEVFGYALSGNQEIRDFFRQTVSLDLDATRPKLEQGSVKFLSELDLEPGSYDLRLLVRDTASGRYALRVLPLTVPDFEARELVILPPFIVDDPRRGVLVRESAGEEADARFPFQIGGQPFVPGVRPVLAGDQPARICLMTYHLDQEQMLLSAGVERRDGTQVERHRLAMVGKGETAADGLDQLLMAFDPRGLEPGEYTLRVGLTDTRTGTTYSQSAAFRVAAQEL